MANTYTWGVAPNGLNVKSVDGRNDTVVSVRFVVAATDGVNTASLHNSVQIPLNSNGTFTPFSELTEAQVVSWVKAELGPQNVGMFQSALDKQLEMKLNPPVRPVVKAAPWATCAPQA